MFNYQDPVYCYVLVRHDVPDFNIGKAAAQTQHNGCQMMAELTDAALGDSHVDALVNEWLSDEQAVNDLAIAMETGDSEAILEATEVANAKRRTFGVAITLLVNQQEMEDAVSATISAGGNGAITHDPTYPIRDGRNIILAPVDTCAYVFGRRSMLSPIVRKFPLMSAEAIREKISIF